MRLALLLLSSCLLSFAACSDGDEVRTQSGASAEDRAALLEAPALIEARVDAARVKLGDRVTLTVEVRHDPEIEVDLPPVLEAFANALIYEAGLWAEFDPPGDRIGHRCEVVLDPGIGPVVGIPAFPLRWRRAAVAATDDEAEVAPSGGAAAEEAAWQVENSEPITVEVEAVTAEDSELIEPVEGFELVPPPAETTEDDSWMVLAGVGGVLVLLGLLALVLFRQKKRRAIAPPSPDEVARRELARLAEMGLLDRGEFQEYYYRLTAILRRYIEDRFGLMAPERTTEEFLAEMRRAPAIPAAEQATLASFLESADLVKYARAEPPHEETQRATETARRFVEATRGGSEGGDHVELC